MGFLLRDWFWRAIEWFVDFQIGRVHVLDGCVWDTVGPSKTCVWCHSGGWLTDKGQFQLVRDVSKAGAEFKDWPAPSLKDRWLSSIYRATRWSNRDGMGNKATRIRKDWNMRKLQRVLAVSCLSLFGNCVIGCKTNLQGAGEAGFGWDSKTRVYIYHEAEAGKKNDKSEAEITSDLVDKLVEQKQKEEEGGK